MAAYDVMTATLQCAPGSVTPFAVKYATAPVRLLLDAGFRSRATLLFHPMQNTATTIITPADLEKFLAALSRPVEWVSALHRHSPAPRGGPAVRGRDAAAAAAGGFLAGGGCEDSGAWCAAGRRQRRRRRGGHGRRRESGRGEGCACAGGGAGVGSCSCAGWRRGGRGAAGAEPALGQGGVGATVRRAAAVAVARNNLHAAGGMAAAVAVVAAEAAAKRAADQGAARGTQHVRTHLFTTD